MARGAAIAAASAGQAVLRTRLRSKRRRRRVFTAGARVVRRLQSLELPGLDSNRRVLVNSVTGGIRSRRRKASVRGGQDAMSPSGTLWPDVSYGGTGLHLREK